MRVRLLVGRIVQVAEAEPWRTESQRRGDVVDVSDGQAARLIAAGQAEPLEAENQATENQAGGAETPAARKPRGRRPAARSDGG